MAQRRFEGHDARDGLFVGLASIGAGIVDDVLDLLDQPDGLMATGWQQHTVRGAMAGALKKKLGLNIVSDKTDGQDRKYRITTETV